MNQREVIAKFIDDRKLKFNSELFVRSDEEIIQELQNVILSCERNTPHFSIKVKKFTVIDDYDQINQILFDYYENAYRNKTKSKKKDNQYGFINLNESDIRLLVIDYDMKARDEEGELRVIVAVPRIVEKYYFRINGIMRSTLYQIVDGSTYNNATSNAKVPSVTMKIVFMAVRVKRFYEALPLTNGKHLKVVHYSSFMFNKSVSACKYILAKYGFYGAMEFFGINGIYITNEELIRDDMYCFIASKKQIYINVDKHLLDNDLMTQTFIVSLFKSIIPGMRFKYVFDPEFWVRSLGAEFNGANNEKMLSILDPNDNSVPDTLEKGYSILDSFESIYDIGTKNSLRLPESEKADMYCVLRWILREFNSLRMKDNLDVSIKTIRFAKYIASLYAMKIAKGIYRVADMNRKASIASIRKAIRTDPNYLLMAISKSNMVSYRNMVSDMDSISGLKFTYKGVSGLGESSNKSIPEIYRLIHPSHVGRLDLDASSDGNPGITGTISPFAPVKDGFFTEFEEPHFWESEYAEVYKEYKKIRGLKEAMVFRQEVLGHELSEEIDLSDELRVAMEQIINPIRFANSGEIYPMYFLGDEENGF